MNLKSAIKSISFITLTGGKVQEGRVIIWGLFLQKTIKQAKSQKKVDKCRIKTYIKIRSGRRGEFKKHNKINKFYYFNRGGKYKV
ncbi:MAG: hypothetical protein GY853_05680 [PVC group bacterium]|nr:hypothetical protein [PVC group bacterium]